MTSSTAGTAQQPAVERAVPSLCHAHRQVSSRREHDKTHHAAGQNPAPGRARTTHEGTAALPQARPPPPPQLPHRQLLGRRASTGKQAGKREEEPGAQKRVMGCPGQGRGLPASLCACPVAPGGQLGDCAQASCSGPWLSRPGPSGLGWVPWGLPSPSTIPPGQAVPAEAGVSQPTPPAPPTIPPTPLQR